MTDIYMKNNRLPMTDGDFVLTSGVEEVKQHVQTALCTFYRDWILDSSKGINYTYGLRNTDFLENDVRNQILGVKNVQSIDNFSLTFNRENLSIQITAAIKTDYGKINISEEISRFA